MCPEILILCHWKYNLKEARSQRTAIKKIPLKLFLFVFWNVYLYGLFKLDFLVFICFYRNRMLNKSATQKKTCSWNSLSTQIHEIVLEKQCFLVKQWSRESTQTCPSSNPGFRFQWQRVKVEHDLNQDEQLWIKSKWSQRRTLQSKILSSLKATRNSYWYKLILLLHLVYFLFLFK